MGLKILYKFAILTNSNDSLLPNLILNLTKGKGQAYSPCQTTILAKEIDLMKPYWKKSLAFLLALAMCLSLLPCGPCPCCRGSRQRRGNRGGQRQL